jgi:phosphoribulokinase
MTTQTFRCYYDDGTITVADTCSPVSSNGSPLIKSELSIIEDVNNQFDFPWWLAILGLIMFFSKERK